MTSTSIDSISRHDDTAWRADEPGAVTSHVEALLEQGCCLYFEHLAFPLTEAEQALLDPALADPKAKNVSLRGTSGALRGAAGSSEQQQAVLSLLQRFRDQACALVDRLFPHYRGHLTVANTSFRPVAVEGRETSWRKDDSRLHVDAFPSNPSQGQRLLRVFSNINPHGQPRTWRLGEPFEDFARRHVADIGRPWPGSAWLMQALRITKRRRSEYDHVMLQLHDRAKADATWQRKALQQTVAFAAGSTWVVFSDQVLHAAMGGQFLLEQTFTLYTHDLLQPFTSPLHTLQRLRGRTLLPPPTQADEP